tara:strand:+ start:1130 stop:1324 length:195 start_codon:yes stop_codon:yes gene_type:complete
MKFYTEENIDVTKNIEKGLTETFTNRKAAEDHARQLNSYYYELLTPVKKNNKVTLTRYGWAVPK